MDMQKDLALFEAAWRVALGAQAPFALSRFAKRRASLSAGAIARLDPAFRSRAYRAPKAAPRWPLSLFLRPRPVDWDANFAAHQETALLAMHAADGTLRERAVRIAPMQDTAARAVLLLRCNDWAEPVRRAAFARLEALLPKLDQEALEPLCLFALDRVRRWQRGGAAAADRLAAHPAWASAVKATFLHQSYGPLALSLRQLLKEPAFDWALPELAMNARSAIVRSVAVETVLTGYARWTEGYDWVWQDKVYNLRRKVPRRGKRLVDVAPSTRAMVLRSACFDKSAKVRSLAASHFNSVGPQGEHDLIETLMADKARSVQWRMAFYTRKRGHGAVPQPVPHTTN